MKKINFILLSTGLFITNIMMAQSLSEKIVADSLSFDSVLKQVIQNYPSIKESQQAIVSANANVGLSKSAYFPNIALSSSYSHLEPVSSISFPGMGTFNMYSADNYSATVNLEQTIYDFGKTAKNVSYANQTSELVKLNETLVKQKISQLVVENFFMLAYLQQAIVIKNEELDNLNHHLIYIQKKTETGSSTDYDILTTQVHIATIENQKTDLETSLKIFQSKLNNLLGKPTSTPITVQNNLSFNYALDVFDSLINKALLQRNEMKIVNQKALLAQIHLSNVNTVNNPSFHFFAIGGFKNGYFPDLAAVKGNYVVGVNFNMPLFDATKTKYNRISAQADIQQIQEEKELTQRTITEDVIENYETVKKTLLKVNESKLQVQQAEKAYHLAEIRFQTGNITNLDLLDNAMALSESRLTLLKNQIYFVLCQYKLKISIGEIIY